MKRVKAIARGLEDATPEERQGLQKIMRFYNESDEEERELLLQFISRERGSAHGEGVVDIGDELDRDLQFISQISNVLSQAEGIGVESCSSIFCEIADRSERVKENADKLFQIAKKGGNHA